MAVVLIAGFLAGGAIAVVTVLAEHSGVAVGQYALSGNGAIIVPALLVPWAVYWGWTGLLARKDRALEMALFVLGLHFGIGVTTVLDALFFSQQAGLTIADALPGFALSGTIFVIPGALLAALTYWLFTTRVPLTSWTVFGAGFLAAVLVVAFWVGLGILTGMCVAAASRQPTRRIAIGFALLVLLVVLGNLPYFPGLLDTA